ncbi:MAG: tRNA threonylcarbamoyladenosine dehydratase [Bacteroidaceae bacterium]|nr:tRNA threonylcarbamoyladenosine dehydratase [Bacteroidaceae bacterium]
MQPIYSRTQRLLGDETLEKIKQSRVIIFGVGGVGSWCAESLVRTGIQHLTIVDADKVSDTNVNRQLMATTETVGRVKVEALKERLKLINLDAEINAVEALYSAETAEQFRLEEYDYIIDAIDSLTAKAQLILHATKVMKEKGKSGFFSSMGAALKLDPTRIKVAEFWKVQGCPLARALRNKFKKQRTLPAMKFLCVYSDELLENKGTGIEGDNSPEAFHKVAFNGSLAHITAIFGFMLAGKVIESISRNE